jgi:signal transduction histidine kinase
MLAEGIAAQAALAVQNAQFFAEVATGRQQLRALSRRLVEVQEAERRAIARELHDEAGQALTSLLLGLGAIQRDANQPESVILRAQEMKAVASNTIEGLHRLAVNLRPASLDRLGLVPAVQQYAEWYRRQNEVHVDVAVLGFDSGGDHLAPEVQTAVYRVIQEALTNIVRHAHASQVAVVVELMPDRVRAVVEDDGVGFDVADARQRGRLGVFGMQERAEALGGTFAIESSAGAGTTVVVEIPLDVSPADSLAADSYPGPAAA